MTVHQQDHKSSLPSSHDNKSLPSSHDKAPTDQACSLAKSREENVEVMRNRTNCPSEIIPVEAIKAIKVRRKAIANLQKVWNSEGTGARDFASAWKPKDNFTDFLLDLLQLITEQLLN